MKRIKNRSLVLIALLLFGKVLLAQGDGMEKPNIVVVMADDIGLGDIGFYHQQRTGQKPLVPTPNIDQLIRSGMRFSDAHSPASLCAPTRFSMLTGNFSYRNQRRPWGVWSPWVDAGIEPKYTTIARIAKQGGYTTAFFGKWGLGGLWETQHKNYAKFAQMEGGAEKYGFDYSLVLPQG
nr:sulfatase-like hydrolase/transferase [Saprospiraceae bacterium]